MSRGASRHSKKDSKTPATKKALDVKIRRLIEQAINFLQDELDLLTNAQGGTRHGGDTVKEVLAITKGLSTLRKDLNASTPSAPTVDLKAQWLKANS